MRTFFIINLMICVGVCFSACKKTATTANYLDGGSINITNAIVGAPTLTMLNDPSVVSGANVSISANNAATLPIVSGKEVVVNIGIPPILAANSTAPAPAIIYFKQTLAVDNQSVYSLFLTGDSLKAIESVLIKENYTRTYEDSVCGVRFINLSPGSNPISVNIQGNANGSEAPGLAYKAYSDFIQHPATSASSSFVFEFRDAASGTLITTYTLNTPYFHNVTLALRGKVGGTAGVILDNDY